MKILLITKNIDNKGGLGRYSRSVIDELGRRGLSRIVVAETGTGYASEMVVLRPLIGGRIKITLAFIANIFAVRRAAEGVDVLHAFDGWPYGVYGYFAVLGTVKKLFITGIGTYSVAPLNGGMRKIFLRRAYLAAKQIFCISDYVGKKILERLPLDNMSTVFMGTIRLQELSDSQIEDFKIKHGLRNNFPILLTVGDIKKRKGQFDSLRAAYLLHGKFPRWQYIMIGSDGDEYYMEQIRQFIKKNKIGGHVKIISNMHDDRELAAFYQASDVFLLNSNNDGEHFEGFGLAILEAAQFGVPTVGSMECGIESAIQDGRSGYLARQGNHEDMKEKILLVLQNKEVLSRRAADFYRDFSWEKTIDKYLEFYTA